MKRMLLALGIIVFQVACSADEPNVQVRLNGTYELKAEYPVIVDKDRFVFSRYDKTGNTKEIVSVVPLSGEEKILACGNQDTRYLADNESYVAFYDHGKGVPGRVKLFRKSDGRSFQSVRLSQGVYGGYFLNDQLVVLQGRSSYRKPTSHWSAFDVPTLKFAREFDAQAAHKIIRLPQETVFLTNQHIGLYDDSFSEKYSANFTHKLVGNGYCDTESLVVTNRLAVFVANCGEIYSFSLSDGQLKSRLRLDQKFYSLASDATYLFAVPEAPVNSPGYTGGVIIELSTWKVVGRFEAMGNAAYANGENLAVMSFPKWSKGLVSVYAYAPNNSLQTRRP